MFAKLAGLPQEMCPRGERGHNQCVPFQMLKKFLISLPCMGTEINLSFSELKDISLA